jgi:O-antigen ligase
MDTLIVFITTFLIVLLVAVVFFAGLLRRLEIGLLGLVFFLPFERIPSLDLAGVTVKINHLIGFAVVLTWLMLVLAGQRLIRPNPLILPTLLFLMTLALSVVGAENSQRAILTSLATGFSLALSLIIPQILVRKDQLKPLLNVLALTSLIAAGFGLYQFIGDLLGLPVTLTGLDPGYTKVVFGFPRIQAFSQEPLYFGNFLLLPISLGLAYLILPKAPWSRTWLFSGLALLGLVFIFTLSRGAFLGLVASLVFLVVILGKHLVTPKLAAISLVSLALIGSLTTGVLRLVSPNALQNFTEHLAIQDFGKGDSTVGRLSTWYQAIDLWQESPWIGTGPGNFGPATLGYPENTPARGWPIVNNQYFETLAETGILGFISFLILFLTLLVRSIFLIRQLPRSDLLSASLVGATAAVVGILVQYNFFSTLYINPIWITVGLLVGLQNLAAGMIQEGRYNHG